MNQLAIYNMAISLAGGRYKLTSVSDESLEATQCELWYETSRDWVFSLAYWPTVRRTAALPLVAENDFADDWTPADPPLPWRFAYGLPPGMLEARGLFIPAADKATIYELYSGADFAFDYLNDQRVICTNYKLAVAQYTITNNDVAGWDVNLRLAVAHALASNIAPALNVKPNMPQMAMQKAEYFITKALENQANADNLRLPEEASTIVLSRGQALDYTDDGFRQ